MTDGVYEWFKRILKNRYIKGDIEPVCYDERGKKYEGFVFLATRSRKSIVRAHVEEYLSNCIRRFNNANPFNSIQFVNLNHTSVDTHSLQMNTIANQLTSN